MSQQVRPVELVLPGRSEPPAPQRNDSVWAISALVAFILLVNAALIWYRLKGRDPLRRAFAGIASRLSLSRAERARIERLAADEAPPVAMLLSDTALERAAAGDPDDPLLVSVRAKVRSARL